MFTLKKFVLATSLAMIAVSSAQAALTTDLDKESYSMGYAFGSALHAEIEAQQMIGAKFNMDAAIAGFSDAAKGKKAQISADDMLKFMNQRQAENKRLQDIALEKQRKANAAQSQAFLDKNAKKKGVTVTASGLQYEVIKAGKGNKPRSEDIVTMHYIGTFMDGGVFVSTYEGKEPDRTTVFSLIPGLEEGLKLMSPGARYRFAVPPKLAYGAEGGSNIPPESCLLFEVELQKVEKPRKSHGSMGGMGGMMNPHQK